MFTHAEHTLTKCVFACSISTEVTLKNYQNILCMLSVRNKICYACGNKIPAHAEQAQKSAYACWASDKKVIFFDFFITSKK